MGTNDNRSRSSDKRSDAKRLRRGEPEDSASFGRARGMVEEEPTPEIDQLSSIQARYAGVSEQDLSRKRIYEELFFTNTMDPYTQLGSARTQRAEQQVKASKAYLQKMTSSKKNLMQIKFIPDAGGQINWISDLDTAFGAINKCAPSLQSETMGGRKAAGGRNKNIKRPSERKKALPRTRSKAGQGSRRTGVIPEGSPNPVPRRCNAIMDDEIS